MLHFDCDYMEGAHPEVCLLYTSDAADDSVYV